MNDRYRELEFSGVNWQDPDMMKYAPSINEIGRLTFEGEGIVNNTHIIDHETEGNGWQNYNPWI